MAPDRTTAVVPSVALGVAAHPDDLDFGASATFAHWVNQGTKVYYLIVTDGSKGSSDPGMTGEQLSQVRRQEQRAAANILGITEVYFLNHEDGKLEVTMDLKKEIVRFIRMLKPEIVVTMDPTMAYSQATGFINHPDHRAVGQATLDAIYPLARDRLSFPELEQEGLKPHITPTALLINLDQHNFCVDVTDTIDKKMSALAAHRSQMSDIHSTQNRMREMARQTGSPAGYDYGEAFLRLEIQKI